MTKYLRTVVYSLLSLNTVILLTSILCIPKLFKFSILFSLLSIIIMHLYTNNKKLLKIFVVYVVTLVLEISLISTIPAISICIIVSIILFPAIGGVLSIERVMK